jgi:uncharacterized OB-fold protein
MEEIVKSIKKTWYVPYKWCYGSSITKFFEKTKNEKKIYGARCTKCKKVLVPAVIVCGRCFAPTEEKWVEVKDEGIIDSFTIVNLPYPGQPTTPPYCYGFVKLDGADTLFVHLISGIPFEKVKVGMRVKAVWNEERKGDLYDIKYFKPVEVE